MTLSKQKGFTLIEMLVALLIASIFFSIFVGVVLATFETLRSGDERTVAQQNARIALNYIADDIRHAVEIAPLRLEAYRDWATGGFPINENVINPYFDDDPDAWPIYRRSTDSDPDGYIELDIARGAGGGEYEDFRDDGFPYDVRPLCPNRISLLRYGSTFYPNTQYYVGFGTSLDLDDQPGGIPNPTSAITRVTYEHQLVRPRGPLVYEDTFSGLDKQFNTLVNRDDPTIETVADIADFVIVRSFEMMNPTRSDPDTGQTAVPGRPDGLGGISDQLQIDEPALRQALADHVVNIRFRYWHIDDNEMIEIRYDPDEQNAGSGINTDDGYYRYFNIYGDEIFVWYNHETGEEVPLFPRDPDDQDYENHPVNSFYIYGGPDGDDEYQRGILLFEGWRFINAVSVTIKTANSKTLGLYRSSINHNITDPDTPDYGMGFIDFGLDEGGDTMLGTLNQYDPFFQAADNVRFSSVPGYGFDFVEPNMNPNYNAGAFTTLQTFVCPPALKDRAEVALRELRYGLNHSRRY